VWVTEDAGVVGGGSSTCWSCQRGTWLPEGVLLLLGREEEAGMAEGRKGGAIEDVKAGSAWWYSEGVERVGPWFVGEGAAGTAGELEFVGFGCKVCWVVAAVDSSAELSAVAAAAAGCIARYAGV